MTRGPRAREPVAPRTREQQKHETRERVFTTAMRLFDARGYEQTSVDDGVRATGLARGTVYFHVPTKDDVLLEAVRRGEALILLRVGALGESARLRRVLEATIDAFLEAWEARRALLPYAGAVSLRRIAGVREASEGDPLRLELGRRVTLAAGRGELSSPLPGPMLADVFLLQVFAALMTWSTTGAPSVEVLRAGLVELFFHGVGGATRTRTRATREG
ncbi:MAG: TetR family transcriptional regulator [Polyangiaceae bacterium]|nr:TetR family transcriptional regulator [Polyangiaceae bacterium]